MRIFILLVLLLSLISACGYGGSDGPNPQTPNVGDTGSPDAPEGNPTAYPGPGGEDLPPNPGHCLPDEENPDECARGNLADEIDENSLDEPNKDELIF